jgi:hypothetical protein
VLQPHYTASPLHGPGPCRNCRSISDVCHHTVQGRPPCGQPRVRQRNIQHPDQERRWLADAQLHRKPSYDVPDQPHISVQCCVLPDRHLRDLAEECRQVTGSIPTIAAGCVGFLGTTPFTVPIASTTTPTNLAGCARTGIGACPVGYSGQYTGTVVSGCQGVATCNVAPFTNTIHDATGTQIGCGDGTACAALFPTSRVDVRSADGATSTACMNGIATQCPTGFAYSIFSSANGRRPLLTQCWVSSSIACATGVSPAAATVPIYDVHAQTNRVSESDLMCGIICVPAASCFT